MNDLEFTWSQPMTELANKFYIMQTEIDRLKVERDRARNMYCYVMANPGKSYYYYANEAAVAKEHGWDCCDKPKKDADLYITSPCGVKYKWDFKNREWKAV